MSTAKPHVCSYTTKPHCDICGKETPIFSESGYTHCACRDCFDISVSSDTRKPELCLLCKDAGCDDTGNSTCDRDDLEGCEG